MREKLRTLRESSGQGAVRYRARHRATKTTRRCWTEFTNQPGNKDWHFLSEVYRATANQDGNVYLYAGCDLNEGVLTPPVADRLTLDLRDLIEAAESWNAARRRTKA